MFSNSLFSSSKNVCYLFYFRTRLFHFWCYFVYLKFSKRSSTKYLFIWIVCLNIIIHMFKLITNITHRSKLLPNYITITRQDISLCVCSFKTIMVNYILKSNKLYRNVSIVWRVSFNCTVCTLYIIYFIFVFLVIAYKHLLRHVFVYRIV